MESNKTSTTPLHCFMFYGCTNTREQTCHSLTDTNRHDSERVCHQSVPRIKYIYIVYIVFTIHQWYLCKSRAETEHLLKKKNNVITTTWLERYMCTVHHSFYMANTSKAKNRRGQETVGNLRQRRQWQKWSIYEKRHDIIYKLS